MSGILLRLRHWLIRKLGGYVEQSVPQPERYLPFPNRTLHPERVIANMRIRYDDFAGPSGALEKEEFFAERAKRSLTEMMVQKIIEKDHIVISCEPDASFPGVRVYSMAICIVPPKEWMLTGLGNIMDSTALRKENQ